MELEQIVNAKAEAEYYTEAASNRVPYVGETLFPSLRNDGFNLSWFKGHGGLPVALRPSALDTQPALRDRLGVQAISTEMPFFREQMRVGEKDRQTLREINSLATPRAKAVVARIYNDAKTLVDGALVNPERERMQLLTTGKISISAPQEDGRLVDYEYDFDVDGSWKKTNSKFKFDWSDASKSDPLGDITKVVEAASTQGVTITRAIVGNNVMAKGRASLSIKKDLNPVGYANTRALSESDFVAYIARLTGVTLVKYNKMYKDSSQVSHYFFDPDSIAFFTDGILGNTYFGITPEEADLTADPGISVSIVENGIAITTFKDKNVIPVNIITSVSEVVLPSFELMDSVFVASVR